MNINDYISSGVLEAYALGDLSADERAAVEQVLVQYPELKKELEKIETTQEKFLMQGAIKPHEEVREQFLKNIGRNKSGKQLHFESSTPSGFWKYAVAASVAIAVIASYKAFDYRQKWLSAEENYSELATRNQRIAEDYNNVNKRIDRIENDLKVLEDPTFLRVALKGTENAPEAIAYVYWNETSKEVYIRIAQMRSLASENQYQLWAIIDGKPVDAGVFDSNAEGLVKMKAIGTGATAFAVTVESKGGKPSPTLSTMQVVGNVDKTS